MESFDLTTKKKEVGDMNIVIIPENELVEKFVRSGGAGGQNVNKVSSKVVIKWDIVSSVVLTDEQKDIVLNKLVNQINSEGFLVVSSQETRDQIKNRKIARDKLNEMINEVLKPQEERKPTKISKAKKDRRVEQNRREGKKKADRRGGKNIKDW